MELRACTVAVQVRKPFAAQDSSVKPVVIIGAGGHARDVLDVFEATSARGAERVVIGFLAESGYFTPGSVINDRPILGDFSWLVPRVRDVELVCAVGDSALRRRLTDQALALGGRFCSVVHPAAVLATRVSIGAGSVIGAGVIMTSLVRVGNHVHVNLACTLAHDVIVDDYVTMAPGARLNGNVRIGEGANIGSGAIVIEKREVGAWSIVGAGAVVVRDVPPNTTAVGCPARVIKTRPAGWHLT
jgi:sugar O-acyltransferase (sialic acid O-acetyltransferase NeuD family)